MSIRAVTIPILFVFLLVSVSGLFLTAGHMGHESGCPLMPGETMALCNLAPLEHIGHWQSAFSSLPAELLILVLVGVLFLLDFFDFFEPPNLYDKRYSRRISHDILPIHLAFTRNVLHPRAP